MNQVQNPESLYGRAVVAFVLMVMLGVIFPLALMAAGLHWGFRVTW